VRDSFRSFEFWSSAPIVSDFVLRIFFFSKEVTKLNYKLQGLVFHFFFSLRHSLSLTSSFRRSARSQSSETGVNVAHNWAGRPACR